MPPTTLRSLFASDPMARVVTPNPREDEEFSAFGDVNQEQAPIDAPTIDDAPFAAHRVPERGETGFTHFLDGAQKARLAMYYGLAPIYLAHTSAALLPRCEREIMSPGVENYFEMFEAFVPTGLPIGDRLAELATPHLVAVEPDATTVMIRKAIHDAISERRDGLEERLAQGFREGRLLIDGGIGKALGRPAPGEETPFVVGLVKSHHKQYFRSRERIDTILGLACGERTTAFYRERDESQGIQVVSFYLRLNLRPDQGPLFGLVRVEIPPEPEFIARIDEIAGWLLHERAPMSLPDARYDRLLYPIRLVEKHLKARQPSEVRLRALVGV